MNIGSINVEGRVITFDSYRKYKEIQLNRDCKESANKIIAFSPTIRGHRRREVLLKHIRLFETHLNKADKEFVLDIGSRTGWASSVFTYDGFNSIAVDLSKNNVIYGRSMGHSIFEADVNDLPYRNETFTAIFCHSAFEHFCDRFIAVEEMCRVLKSNGKIMVAVPIEFTKKILRGKVIRSAHCEFFYEKEQLLGYFKEQFNTLYFSDKKMFVYIGEKI